MRYLWVGPWPYSACGHGPSFPYPLCPLVMAPVLVCGMAPLPTWLPRPDPWALPLDSTIPPNPQPTRSTGETEKCGEPHPASGGLPASAVALQAFLSAVGGGSWHVLESDHVSVLVSRLRIFLSHGKAKSSVTGTPMQAAT